MRPAFLAAAGNTRFGTLPGSDPIGLMAQATDRMLEAACLPRQAIDGVLTGYATTLPHLMLASLLCERAGLRPGYAHAMQAGGATGAAMLMLARDLVRAGRCDNVLVVAGENRASGQTRDTSIGTLAQVGDPDLEVPNGMSVPAYYGLLAARYLHETGLHERDLAAFSVAMRAHAAQHPDAHLRTPLGLDDVMSSKPIASPLKLLDCCPISDGAVALLVSAAPRNGSRIWIRGAGQAHRHQHLSALGCLRDTGGARSARAAFDEAGLAPSDIDLLGIYDSFTVTLALLLEETGFAGFGQAPARLAAGVFGTEGPQPLNPHGGLLSFGHCGVAGGMAHAAELWRQLAGVAGASQIPGRRHAYLHADGGVMSAHVSLVLSRIEETVVP